MRETVDEIVAGLLLGPPVRTIAVAESCTGGLMAARLTGTGLAILLALASPALAREGAPNVVEGHPTNAFMPGFPETIDGLVRESIQSKPAEGRIVANYRAPDDNRLVQMLLYALYDGDIARNVERAEAYMADGEIPVTRASVTSPEGA